MENVTLKEKACTGCKTIKLLSDFHIDRKNKSGRRHKCKVCITEYNAKWQQENKEAINARNRKRYSDDPHKKIAEVLLYKKNNPDKDNAWKMKRHAAKLQRTPAWADDWKIRQFYTMAQKLQKLYGVKFQVDHVIPLRGELVSGLHVETNLQIITASENSSKGNRFIPGHHP